MMIIAVCWGELVLLVVFTV